MRWTLAGVVLVIACSGTKGGGDSASVLERNKHPSRDGYFVEPALTSAAVARMALDTTFIAVTTGNDVFALDETTGAVVWTRNIGPSPTDSGAGCGGIHPIGIVSTPVIDAGARTLFLAGALGTTAIDRHEVHALSVEDGSERAGWPVNV